MSVSQLDSIIQVLEDSFIDDISQESIGNGIIKTGYDTKIDEYRKILQDVKKWLTDYQYRLSQETSISNLRIKFTSQSGYFIEISKAQIQKIPENFIHTQTLVNASRFTTKELNDFQAKLFEAEDHMLDRENQVFSEIRERLLKHFDFLKQTSFITGNIDYISGLSRLAYQSHFVRPQMHIGYDIEIQSGRHPIIERIHQEFVSNSLTLSKSDYIHLITGPNMGGKSTYLRQNALIILLAHIGSFVPAKTAKIPIVDKIFSRVGAYDNLYLGQSTFMVEMQEVSNILHNATKNSFVIVDEIGRGTSTYDGMSLAWSILVYLHNTIGVKTLFATHYHEITDLSCELTGVGNYSVAVGENNDNIVFLRKIVPGAMKQSYGIEVAKIAGLPEEVLTDAKKFLSQIITDKQGSSHQLQLLDINSPVTKQEDTHKDRMLEEIKNLDINLITPLQALSLLSELQEKSKKK